MTLFDSLLLLKVDIFKINRFHLLGRMYTVFAGDEIDANKMAFEMKS